MCSGEMKYTVLSYQTEDNLCPSVFVPRRIRGKCSLSKISLDKFEYLSKLSRIFFEQTIPRYNIDRLRPDQAQISRCTRIYFSGSFKGTHENIFFRGCPNLRGRI